MWTKEKIFSTKKTYPTKENWPTPKENTRWNPIQKIKYFKLPKLNLVETKDGYKLPLKIIKITNDGVNKWSPKY